MMATDAVTLIARARLGDPAALAEICELYRCYIRAYGRAGLGPKLRERVDLSDVVQETLVEVLRQFPQFTGQDEAALVGWLRRLVGQKLADLARHHSRLKRGAGEKPQPLDSPWTTGKPTGEFSSRLLDVLSLSQTSPSEVASRRELGHLLTTALDGLPQDEAEILWLYHGEQLSFNVIAERLDVSRKIVRGVWARGLKNLRRALGSDLKASMRP